jgi:hypothetical protein
MGVEDTPTLLERINVAWNEKRNAHASRVMKKTTRFRSGRD